MSAFREEKPIILQTSQGTVKIFRDIGFEVILPDVTVECIENTLILKKTGSDAYVFAHTPCRSFIKDFDENAQKYIIFAKRSYWYFVEYAKKKWSGAK